MNLHNVFHIALLLCTFLWTAQARSSYNLTYKVKAPYVAKLPTKGGNLPGIDVPVNVSVDPNTLWYWCGFEASNKLRTVWTSTRNIQSFLVRHHRLKECKLGHFDSCLQVEKSKCDKVQKCNVRLHGFAIGGDVCFALANNANKTAWVNLRVIQEHDGALAGGKAGSVILLLALIGWAISPAFVSIYSKVKKSKGKQQD